MFLRPGNYNPVPSGNPGGFALPNMGGDVGMRYGTMNWTGTIGTLFQLPAGATIIDWTTFVIEAFGGGTASARVGDTTTNNRWASTIDIGTTGLSKSGWVGSQVASAGTLAEDTYVLAKLNAPGTATAGTLGVVCYYVML